MECEEFEVIISCGQFLIWDESESRPGLLWTQRHCEQGFARRESVVAVASLIEHGRATVRVYVDSWQPNANATRVIAVPFNCASGHVHIEGPEESDLGRRFSVDSNVYRLVISQQRIRGQEDREDVCIYWERSACCDCRSEILVADCQLTPPTDLLETADYA